MKDVEMVKGDEESDSMLLCAVQSVMREQVDLLIRKFAELVPPDKGEQFIDYVAEACFVPYRWGQLFKREYTGSPNLWGDEAYREYVREVMGVK